MAAGNSEICKNILVIGETGVGKSTFINAFVNYMKFSSLQEAEEAENLVCLVPTKFTVTDENLQERIVSVGLDSNESGVIGAAATQGTKSYIFPIGNRKIRIIDTPGIGDPRGIDQDNKNSENILQYISKFDELHGICILLKPNNARLTVLFEFCIKQLLSKLEKSASENIVFIFTNSRSTFYRPGDTLPPLKEILKQIKSRPPHVEIPLTKKNVFCLDNEAFRFLVSIRNSITFTEEEKRDFAFSWNKSSEASWALINYICGEAGQIAPTPHKVQNTVSINQAREVILQLSQPLAEIAQLIIDNLNILRRHKKDLKCNTDSLEELKDKLYIPIANLKVEELPQPRTVCTNTTCCTVYQVEGVKKWHYSTKCHDPCQLENVPKEIVGAPELIECWAMDPQTGQCRICSCDFRVHMHIYYQTEVISDHIVDENVKSEITGRTITMTELKKHIDKINARRDAYENEKNFIIKSTAKFAYFLQNNAIAPYNDAYQAYIEYLIDREHSMGSAANKDMINHLRTLLKQYNEEKGTLNRAMDLNKQSPNETCTTITAEDIFDCVHQLYGLEYTGPKIEELFNKQKNARSSETKRNTEYVHPEVIRTPEEKSKLTNGKKGKGTQNKGQPNQPDDAQNNLSTVLASTSIQNPRNFPIGHDVFSNEVSRFLVRRQQNENYMMEVSEDLPSSPCENVDNDKKTSKPNRRSKNGNRKAGHGNVFKDEIALYFTDSSSDFSSEDESVGAVSLPIKQVQSNLPSQEMATIKRKKSIPEEKSPGIISKVIGIVWRK